MNTTNDSTSLRHPLSKMLPKRPVGPMAAPARVLGWFSIGLGLAEILAPRPVARGAGIPDASGLVRAYGLREIGVGVGLLRSRNPAPWLWGRVAGDVLDIASVAAGLGGPRPVRSIVSLLVLGGITAIDAKCAMGASKGIKPATRDYSDRTGFPKNNVTDMRGVARRKPAVAAINSNDVPVGDTATATSGP